MKNSKELQKIAKMQKIALKIAKNRSRDFPEGQVHTLGTKMSLFMVPLNPY